MKNKSAVLFALGCLAMLVTMVHAASGVRGAKSSAAISGHTQIVGISSGPAVVYSVVLGTGIITDWMVLFDSNAITGLAKESQSTAFGFKMRLYPSTSTANTAFFFDPPLQFNNGIMAANATAVQSTLVTYERGRVTQGY